MHANWAGPGRAARTMIRHLDAAQRIRLLGATSPQWPCVLSSSRSLPARCSNPGLWVLAFQTGIAAEAANPLNDSSVGQLQGRRASYDI